MFSAFRARIARAAQRRVYLDYAAATPVRPDVYRAMRPYFSAHFANPGAIHREGARAAGAVAEARRSIADALRVRSDDVIFTSGGTESNNLALMGSVAAAHAAGTPYHDIEIITTAIEHPSVYEVCESLRRLGVVVQYTPVDADGRIVLSELTRMLSAQTLLVSIAYVNSEIGVVEDVKRVSRAVRARRAEGARAPFVHVDASQAPLWLPCAPDALGADLMTLDAGKCYGPKGAGVLIRRKHVPLAPYMLGGGQERGLRPGTENVPLIVGCAKALSVAQAGHARRAARVQTLRDMFIESLEREVPGICVNGSRAHRVANNVNVSVPGIDGEFAVVTLDACGIAASTRSACAGGTGSGSHVVRALTGDDARAASTVRFTLGEETTRADINTCVRVLAQHVRKTLSVTGGADTGGSSTQAALDSVQK